MEEKEIDVKKEEIKKLIISVKVKKEEQDNLLREIKLLASEVDKLTKSCEKAVKKYPKSREAQDNLNKLAEANQLILIEMDSYLSRLNIQHVNLKEFLKNILHKVS